MKKTATKPEVNEYDQQADSFMKLTNTTMTAKFKAHQKYFAGDDKARDVYIVTLKNDAGRYTFTFGQSNQKSDGKTPPLPYDILSCFTKYDPGSYEEFCREYGYDIYNSRTGRKEGSSFKIYTAVCKEYEAICRLFTEDQIELMAEIQ